MTILEESDLAPTASSVRSSPVKPPPRPITTLDLFAGAGGLSLGLHRASERYEITAAVEQDVSAAATYMANFGDVVHVGNIEDWLREGTVPKVDLVVGGPPCQGFSLIGKRDPNDRRNSLWRSYAEVLRRAKPRAFVMENVPAFVKSDEYSQFIDLANSTLQDYEIQARVLNAADHGAPQVRKRAIVIGIRSELVHPGFPEPGEELRATVRDALHGITPFAGLLDLPSRRSTFNNILIPGPFSGAELHFTRLWTELSLDRIRSIPYGGSRKDLPDHLSMDCWRNHPRSASDVMGRLEWEKPSVTIRTEFFKPEKGRFLHPTQHRAITHWEAARLQGFPDEYQWMGDRHAIARQIGNAVPVQLAEAIGRRLVAAL